MKALRVTQNYWELEIGTFHLPLQWIKSWATALLTLNTPWNDLRVEIRSEVLIALEKLGDEAIR